VARWRERSLAGPSDGLAYPEGDGDWSLHFLGNNWLILLFCVSATTILLPSLLVEARAPKREGMGEATRKDHQLANRR